MDRARGRQTLVLQAMNGAMWWRTSMLSIVMFSIVGFSSLAVAPLVAPGAFAAGETTCSNFDATAAADGVRSGVSSPGFLIVEQVDIQGPAAQAAVNALGVSRAFAGAPYPGEAAMSAVALAGADPGSYPLAVSSQYPAQPHSEADNPVVQLEAESAELSSGASARGDGGSTGQPATAGAASATAKAACSSGTVRSDAESVAEALSFSNGLLRVGRVFSEAHAVIGSDGQRRLQSRLTAAEITVAGQSVVLTEKGLQAAGSTSPVPENPALAPLKDAGIDVSYIKSTKDSDGKGVLAPALKVELTREVTGTGPTVITYTFGRAYARAGSVPEDALAEPPVPRSPQVSPGAGAAPADPIASAPAADQSDGAAPVQEAPSEAPAPAVAPPAGDHSDAVHASAFRGPEFSSEGLYLSLMGGAVAVLLGGLSLRIFGVRLGWT